MKSVLRDRWPEVKALFEAASARPRDDRAAWLAAQPVDADLVAAVSKMLDDAGDDTFNAPFPDPATPGQPGNDFLAPGARIGRYRVLRLLGKGGMGVVYQAEQSNPHRRVALKQLFGSAGSAALARFRREAELLARLSHPGIARIIEIDADDQGRPFLVMEFVDGRDLAAHVVGWSRAQRLELLARIADAVEHAHARGVVHRDLKPANILVDAEGHPRVLDFGIGHVMGEGQTLTETGMLLGTPAYMSPEQAAGTARVDARSDVYALGVIAYELIADRLPLPVAGMTPLEALRMVGEATPPPLSKIDRALGGDLEVIIETALAKEPRMRYATAGAFADDLRRYLASEPIRARRPGFLRRAMLYTARKPVQVGAIAAAVVGLVGGSLMALSFALTAEQERARAEIALEQAHGTQRALARVFAAGNPAIAGKPEVPFRDVLAAAPSQLDDVPAEVRLPVQYTVALAQAQVGADQSAIEGFAEAARIAGSLGQGRARAQAELRRIMLAVNHVSGEESMRSIEQLLADPDLLADPLLLAGARSLAAHIALMQFRNRTAAAHAEVAQVAWSRVVAAPLAIDDTTLAAELEITRYESEVVFGMAWQKPGRDPAEVAAQLKQAHARISPGMPPDHPRLAALRVAADNLEDALAGRAEWRARLLAEIQAQIPRLGLTHPTILAQVQVGMELAKLQQIADVDLHRQLLAIARAMPERSRQRLRLMMWAAEAGPQISTLGMDADEIARVRAPVCQGVALDDLDCVWSALNLVWFQFAEGRNAEAFAGLDTLISGQAELRRPLALRVYSSAASAYLRAGRHAEAVAAAEAAIAVARGDPELDEDQRNRTLMMITWSFRPHRCDRVLEVLTPIEASLASNPLVPGDVLARLMATCAVRAGHDADAALARLAPWWRKAQQAGIDPLVPLEVVNAHLEIFDVLGRDADFRHWAGELANLQAAGLDLDEIDLRHMPWIQRARALAPVARTPAR